jgi:4-hydroxy-L-threonine phosphate dehydrogenase PdxA
MNAANMSSTPTRVGVVIGDPNGIGPEIAIKAACALDPALAVRPVLIGDRFVIDTCAERLGVTTAQMARFDTVDVQALSHEAWQPGQVDARAGEATVEYVKKAIELHSRGELSAVAACPHSETAVNAAGIPFSGYSGLVADLTNTPRDQVFLMLEACGVRIVHATLHEQLARAITRLTPALVMSAAMAAHRTVQRMGIIDPHVCILGINPHAGEFGLFGDDDERITRPAAEQLRAQGLKVDGPIGADLALAERKHDVYLAMFHDQGHIAVKMLSPKGAAAIVVGAPVLFASVGHGAAFNIAGQGIADASAMTSTLALLCEAVA